MPKVKRNVMIALTTTVGVLALIGASVGGSRGERVGSPFGSRDVLSRAVAAGELSAYLAAEDARAGFRTVGAAVTLSGGDAEVRATMAFAPTFQPHDSATAAEGNVLYRIDADADYAPLGLSRGGTYLWMDAKGPAENPWRGIMVSADGTRRTLMPTFSYTPATEHNDFSPLEHARLYCGGEQGCLFLKQTATGLRAGPWTRCVQGCCEIENALQRTRPPKP